MRALHVDERFRSIGTAGGVAKLMQHVSTYPTTTWGETL